MSKKELKLIITIEENSDYFHIHLGENHTFCSTNKKEVLDRIAVFLYFRDGKKKQEDKE